MTTKNPDNTSGVLVRGDDGSMYFVPHEKLAAYKVPDKGVADVASKIPAGAVAAHTEVPTAWMMAMPACFISSNH